MKKLLILTLALTLALVFWYTHALGPVDPQHPNRTKITIESGWTTMQIIDHLKDRNLIRSPLAFKTYLKVTGLDGSLQAGVFLLDQSQSVSDLARILQTGRAEEMIVTIPEGFTVQEIDDLLTEMELITKGEAVRCASACDFSSYEFLPQDISQHAKRGGKLEGYLFPDTYYVPAEDFVVKFFFERMLNAFRREIYDPYKQPIATKGRTFHDFLTMASLVEEETRTDEERPLVAGILWKRFDADWGLGIDAAVRYIVDKPTAVITHADLNVDSPYNLRKFRGIPPGPIANVGVASIRATLHPKTSEYWYYLHDREGNIHYSKTNGEHNEKRYRYLGSGSN